MCNDLDIIDSSEAELKIFNEGLHPLMIDHVLENVLEYLASDDNTFLSLYCCRLVCHKWLERCNSVLKKKLEITFGDHYECTLGKFETFIAVMKSHWYKPHQVPFVRFNLHPELFEEANKHKLLDFFEIMSPHIKKLLINMDVKSDISFPPGRFHFIRFENLNSLAYMDRRRSHTSPDFKEQKLLSHIIETSRDILESLTILVPREPAFDYDEKDSQVIRILEANHLKQLRHLKLDMEISDRVLERLSMLKIKLKSFHLSLGASYFKKESFTQFLDVQKDNLSVLKLSDLYRRSTVVFQLPNDMKKLKILEIHGFELPSLFISFPSFSYDRCVQNLEQLYIRTWAPTPDWEVFIPKPNVHNYTVLRLSLAMNFGDPALMLRIAHGFKRLKKLDMFYSRATMKCLKVVFQNMGQLEELTLHQSYLGEISTNYIDDVLTGLTSRECIWIRKNKAYDLVDLHQATNQAGLLSLKNLKKFDMVSLRYRNLITDVSGFLVFLQMKSLNQLVIGSSELSEPCLKALAQKFPQSLFQQYISDKRVKLDEDGMFRSSSLSPCCIL